MPTDIYTLGIEVDSTDVVVADDNLDDLARSADKAGNEVQDLGNKSKTAGAKTKTMSAGAKSAGTSTKSLGRNAGQAGIQIQQMVGQIQGGQSAFVALSQQSADLGFVLGAPLVGVIVSLGAVLAGTLVAALKTTKVQAEDLIPKIIELREEWQALTDAQTRLIKRDIAKRQEEINDTITKLSDKLALAQQQYDGYSARLEAANENNRAGATFVNLMNERMDAQRITMDNTTAAIDTERQALERLNNELGILNGESDKASKSPFLSDDSAAAEAFNIRMMQYQEEQAQIAAGYEFGREMLASNIAQEQALRDAAAEEEMILALEHRNQMTAIYARSASAITTNEILELERRAEAAEQIEQATQENVLAIDQSFDSIFRDLMDTQSKELFEIGKVGAASKAAFDAYGAINATLAQGGALAAPAAWAIGAAAFINVSKILGTKYGGTGGGAGSAPNIPEPQQQTTTENTQNVQNTFNITGGNSESIAGQIQELFDSGSLSFRNGSVISA